MSLFKIAEELKRRGVPVNSIAARPIRPAHVSPYDAFVQFDKILRDAHQMPPIKGRTK